MDNEEKDNKEKYIKLSELDKYLEKYLIERYNFFNVLDKLYGLDERISEIKESLENLKKDLIPSTLIYETNNNLMMLSDRIDDIEEYLGDSYKLIKETER